MTAELFVQVRILVGDDDSICLSVIAAYLRTLKHEVLSTIVEQRFPPKNLHSSQQLYNHLVKLRGNTQDQPEETPKQSAMASDDFISERGNNRLPLSVTRETTTVINSYQRRLLAMPAVARGNHLRNGGDQNEEALGATSGSFVILDSSNELPPDQGNGNNFLQQINCQSHFPSGDNGEDPLLTVIKSFDHLRANSFTNIHMSGELMDVIRDTSKNFNRAVNLEAPTIKSPMVDYESADQDWMDFMDSLWWSKEDFSWD